MKTKIKGFYGGTDRRGKRSLFPVGGGSTPYVVEFADDGVFYTSAESRIKAFSGGSFEPYVKSGQWKKYPRNPFGE